MFYVPLQSKIYHHCILICNYLSTWHYMVASAGFGFNILAMQAHHLCFGSNRELLLHVIPPPPTTISAWYPLTSLLHLTQANMWQKAFPSPVCFHHIINWALWVFGCLTGGKKAILKDYFGCDEDLSLCLEMFEQIRLFGTEIKLKQLK